MNVQEEILNLTLSTIADTEIAFSKPVLSVSIQNRDAANAIYYRANSGDSTYHTIKPGSSLQRDLSIYAAKSCGWLRAAAGTGPAEVVGLLTS